MKKGWVVAGIVVGLVALVLIGLLIAGGLLATARGGFGPHVMMGRYGDSWGVGQHGGGRMVLWGAGLFLLLLLLAVVFCGAALATVWYVRKRQKVTGVSGGNLTPMDILKKRYASGEIDREQYGRMREELT
jgi:putative membrane protein